LSSISHGSFDPQLRCVDQCPTSEGVDLLESVHFVLMVLADWINNEHQKIIECFCMPK